MTVVMNGETGEVLHMAKGKKKTSLESFFERFPLEKLRKSIAFCIDRAGECEAVIQEYAAKATIVTMKFILSATSILLLTKCVALNGAVRKRRIKKIIKGQRFKGASEVYGII